MYVYNMYVCIVRMYVCMYMYIYIKNIIFCPRACGCIWMSVFVHWWFATHVWVRMLRIRVQLLHARMRLCQRIIHMCVYAHAYIHTEKSAHKLRFSSTHTNKKALLTRVHMHRKPRIPYWDKNHVYHVGMISILQEHDGMHAHIHSHKRSVSHMHEKKHS